VDGLWLRYWPPPLELSGDVPDDDVGLVLDAEPS
jgi:hypothetical protein